MSTILLCLAFLSIFTSKTLGSAIEILSILCIIYAFFTKKISFPRVRSYQIGLVSAFTYLIISILNIALGKTNIGAISILRHDFYPLALGAIAILASYEAKNFKALIEQVIKCIFIGLLATTLYNFYLAFQISSDLSSLFLGKRFGGITGINQVAYCISGLFPLVFCYILNEFKLRSTSKVQVRLAISCLVLMFINLYLCRSRGPILAILIFSPLCVYFYFKKFFLYSFTVSFLVLSIGGAILYTQPNLKSRYFLPLTTKSNMQRLVQYEVAMDLTKSFPLLGVGLKNYAPKSVELKKKLGYKYADFHSHAHNTFLHVFAELGFIGGGLFLIFWIFVFLESWMIKGDELARGIFTSGFGVFILQSIYDHVFQVFFAVLASSLLALYWIYQKSRAG